MRKPALAILLLFITLGISAQDLRGRILEINEEGDTVPVVYAMVQWMNTSVGTFTDDDGTFALPRTTTDTLVISYAAYSTEKLRIGKEQDDLTFILSKGQTLDEVQESERRYLEAYLKHPFATDWKYFWGIVANIIFNKKHSA